MFKLINQDGREVSPGDKVLCFRGTEHEVVDFYPPKHSASSGRVVVKAVESGHHCFEYYPQVFNLKIVGEWDNEE